MEEEYYFSNRFQNFLLLWRSEKLFFDEVEKNRLESLMISLCIEAMIHTARQDET